jgi:hypothetical protein
MVRQPVFGKRWDRLLHVNLEEAKKRKFGDFNAQIFHEILYILYQNLLVIFWKKKKFVIESFFFNLDVKSLY